MSEMVINGYQIDLPEGRHVFVAEQEDCFLIQLCRENDKYTRLKLTKEAAHALAHLIKNQSSTDDLIKSYFRQISQTIEKVAPKFEWQQVKADDLPIKPLSEG